MKPSRVGRIVRILTILQSEKKYTASDLAKLLNTSRRTIFRDLKELGDIGVPYHYDPKTRSYAIAPEFFLPPIDLNLQEALSMLLIIHKTGPQVQLPFKNSAILAALKIENQLPDKIRRYCGTALDSISTRLAPQAPANLLDKIFATLQVATATKRKVYLEYQSVYDDDLIKLELSPYHLMYNHRAWYVIGRSSIHKETRTFKLNRIKKVETLDKCFLDTKRFDLSDHLGRAWSMIREGRIYNIKLKFLPKVAKNVTEVQWHSTQKYQFNPDGSATMEFRVDGLGEISWWILGYADQVQVLAPRALRKKVLEMAAGIIKINS